jgi:hypothetical protein
MAILRIHGRGLAAALALLAVWAVLATRNPNLTYHFAPLLAGAAWPALLRDADRVATRDLVIAGLGGFALVSGSALLLAASGYLDGPTFWNDGPAVTEAVLFAAAGSGGGVLFAAREGFRPASF